MTHKTIEEIKAYKGKGQPMVCLTAYTTPMAAIIAPHADVLLVGDSLGMVLYGMDSTREVTLDMMIAHGKAVMRRREGACIIVDMPFGTYEGCKDQALKNAQRVMDETLCDGIKLEGGTEIAPTIKHLTERGIPVMAHIGLMPQSVADGKFQVQGKTVEQSTKLLADAKAVETAGAFAVVIEGTIEPVAAHITQILAIPTIGIGASAACDGQILVTEDMIGLPDTRAPKFVKQYTDIKPIISKAVAKYSAEVRSRAFPGPQQLYTLPESKQSKAS